MPKTTKGVSEVLDWLKAHINYDGAECLIWPFARIRGYAHISHEESAYAHVVMCTLVNGPRPSPKHHAAHSCGRGEDACVHPKHLCWKTPSENMLDKREHGRFYREGVRYKLTPADVAQIRSLKGKKTQDQMATMFGVSRRNIGAILSGRSWPTGDYVPRGFAIRPYKRPRKHADASGQSSAEKKS